MDRIAVPVMNGCSQTSNPQSVAALEDLIINAWQLGNRYFPFSFERPCWPRWGEGGRSLKFWGRTPSILRGLSIHRGLGFRRGIQPRNAECPVTKCLSYLLKK